MKKIFAILAAAAICAVSCTKLGIPTVEFGTVVGNFYPALESTPVAVRVNIAQDNDCQVTIKASYNSLTEEISNVDIPVVIPAGEREVYVDIPNIEGDVATIRLTLTALPSGFVWGGKLICILTPSFEEPLVYSFEAAEGNVHESFIAKIKLQGVETPNWTASKDMTFTAKLSGAGAADVECEGVFKLLAGENTAKMTIVAKSGVVDASKPLSISVVASGLIAGDNDVCDLVVRGIPSKSLEGTWKFSELIDAEEMELWFMEYEDDFSLCPAKNDGFEFTIAEKDGAFTFTPNTTGDFAKYFRTATMSPCEPINTVANAVTLGNFSANEGNMFVAEVYSPYQQSLFYELSSVNRSFDTTEKLGKGAMSISFLDDDSIIVTIRDYDEPPFGMMWWDEPLDPEMFGFASVFTRAK